MDPLAINARQDRAIENSDDDALDRGPFVDSLVRALVHTERDMRGKVTSRRSTGFVVGLTGEWGLGKTSVLNLLYEQLNSYDRVAVAVLNPWLFNNRDDLLNAYFNSLRGALGRTPKEHLKGILKQLDQYKNAIDISGTLAAAAIDLHGGGGHAVATWRKYGKLLVEHFRGPSESSPEKERKSLEDKLKKADVAVVVLIDELDRVEDEEVRAVAQLIKAVGDIKGISYLVSYDPKRVVQALGRGNSEDERQRSGEAYLEKIVQLPIPLRPLFADDARALLQAALKHNGVELHDAREEYQKAILAEIIGVASTPREIKRAVGAFAVLEEITRGEICPYDVLGYSWLATKAPGVRDAIARNLEKMVNDPGEPEIHRRMEVRHGKEATPETPTRILGGNAGPRVDLLKLLFPRFGTRDETNAGNRIAKRRNLVRLLYLGNPPGMVHRAEIERIWNISDPEEMTRILRSEFEQGRLPGLLDRLSDLLPQLPPDGDTIFWPAYSQALLRRHDWISQQEPAAGLVDDAGTLLWSFGAANEVGNARFTHILESLVTNEDLLIAPWLLRRHIFAHGLIPDGKPNGRRHIIDRATTERLLEQELTRYRQAILDGSWLRRSPDSEIIYYISNLRRWDDELRTLLTAQLSSFDAVTTFAALMTHPGVSVGKSTFDVFIDTALTHRTVVELVREHGEPTDYWMAASLRRFVAILRGEDPIFPDDYDENYILSGDPGADSQPAETIDATGSDQG